MVNFLSLAVVNFYSLVSIVHLRGGMAMEEGCGSPPWLRAELIDRAVDHISVAESVASGPLAVMEVVLTRCKALGVPDPTLE